MPILSKMIPQSVCSYCKYFYFVPWTDCKETLRLPGEPFVTCISLSVSRGMKLRQAVSTDVLTAPEGNAKTVTKVRISPVRS